MKMTLQIDNRDLMYSVDTYHMFTGESVYELEAEHYIDEYGIDPDQVDFELDHKLILKDLAEESINILCDELKGLIVHDIILVDTGSPRFYNYTTDHYTAEWTIDVDYLELYIKGEHAEAFESFIDEHWAYEYTKAVAEDDVETQIVVALDFWTRQVLPEDDYNMSMWERETEAYMNHIEPSESMKKAIKEIK